jgi:hypothetical protein
MANVLDVQDRPRAYGNILKPRSAGLWKLGLLGTGMALLLLVADIIVMFVVGFVAGTAAIVLTMPAVVLLLRPDVHGRTGAVKVTEALGGRLHRSRARYRSGPTSLDPRGSHRLPGVLGASLLSEGEDAFGRAFAVLIHPWVGQLTVVLETEPDGAALTDQWQVDQWVARYGSWLAALPQEAGLVATAVSIEAAPDPGTRLRHMLDARTRDDAPEFAREVVAEMRDTFPSGSSELRARVALTYQMRDLGGRKLSATELAHQLATRLGPLCSDLSATGAGVAIPVDAQRLCEIVRVAYDPRSAELLEHARVSGEPAQLEWEDVGPAEAFADYKTGCYRHDGALSVTWEMSQAPRGEFHERVLAKLLAPNRYIARKRVTLLYRVIPGGEAAKIVENAVKTADFRVRTDGRRATARDRLEAEIAKANARDEARGAALTEIGMLVTATVLEEDGLQAAIGAVQNVAPTARVNLRVPRSTQDSLFAAALPLGVWLPEYMRIPEGLRRAL